MGPTMSPKMVIDPSSAPNSVSGFCTDATSWAIGTVFGDDHWLSGGRYLVHNLEAFSFELGCDDFLHNVLGFMTMVMNKGT